MMLLSLLLLPMVLAAEREWNFGKYSITTENNDLKSVECDGQRSKINLANLGLKSLGANAFNNNFCAPIYNINLANNWLSTVPQLAFDNLRGLNSLSIADNEISDIAWFAFRNSRQLSYVDISNNRLTQLGKYEFFGTNDQIYIDVEGNNLTNMSSLLFTDPEQPVKLQWDNQMKMADSKKEKMSTAPTSQTHDGTSVKVCIEENILTLVEYVKKDDYLASHCHEVQIKNAELSLRGNDLIGISNGTFSKVNHLTKLDLSYNNISKLEKGSLHGLLSLQFLDLSHNNLMTIERGTFEDVTALRDLNLGSNFVDLYKGVYTGLENIEVLNIADNGLTEITGNTLYAMPDSLETVILDSNNIKKLEDGSFIRVPKHTLSLERNQITEISPGSLNLPYLKRLSLAWNNIEVFSPGVFQSLKYLEFLDLTNNTIERFGSGSLGGLSTSHECIITISGMPIKFIHGSLFNG